jgi:DNA polymerase-1
MSAGVEFPFLAERTGLEANDGGGLSVAVFNDGLMVPRLSVMNAKSRNATGQQHQGVLYLVDGMSFVFRGYHAMGDFRSARGVPTGAVLGFVNMLNAFLASHDPKCLGVAFDTGEPTFREDLFRDYKSQREAPPEELTVQLPYVMRWLDAMRIPRIESPGYEADDILGTLARRAEAEGWEVIIVSGDKDLLQLVTESVKVLSTYREKSKLYDEAAVRERYRCPPERLPDLLGLMGDSSDNIPGVPGIGEKTGGTMIEQYGSLEGVYEHLDEIRGKRRETLREHRDAAFLSRELATIRTDVSLDVEWEAFRRQEPDIGELRSLYEELDFSRLLAKLEDSAPGSLVEEDYVIVRTAEQLRRLADDLKQAARFAIDTETTSLRAIESELVGVSVCRQPGEAYYVPVGHRSGEQVSLSDLGSLLGPVLQDRKIGKILHHSKFDVLALRRGGMELRGIVSDTLLQAALVEPTGASLSLESLAQKHAGKPKLPGGEFFQKGKTIAEAPIEQAGEYACRDAEITLLLGKHYAPLVAKEPLQSLYHEVELPLSSVLAEMEWVGVRVEPGILKEQSHQIGAMADEVAARVYEAAGERFNINSPKQLGEILYEKLRLLSGRKRTTRADRLEKLAARGNEFARLVLEYRQLAKLKNTYLDALPTLISEETGRVHTSYSQTVTATGRISSSDPNLQNIPIRSELGKRVREAFVPNEGWILFSADYSQIELRIVAHYSQDPGLTEAFIRGEDIHRRTAADIFDVAVDAVTPEQRSRAKAINFGLHYGMTERGLADRLGIPVEEAADYRERYFARYPKVREHIERLVSEATARGWVTTLLGREIHIHGLKSSNRLQVEQARREAINRPIQGSAADMLKKAMVAIAGRLEKEKLHSRMILTVHDEVILEGPESELEAVGSIVVEAMEQAIPLMVPVVANTSWGRSWAALS